MHYIFRMFKTLTLSALTATAMVASSHAQSAKLVSVTAAAGVPEGADYQVKPMGYEYGVTLHFFVEGENMISFDKDSLKAKGWKLGSFPKVGDDGTQGSFSIHKKGDFLGKADALKAEGSVVVFTGSETKSLTQKMAVGAEPVEMGPYKVHLGKSKGMFGGEGLNVTGEIMKIKEVTVMQGGKKLKNQGSSWSGKSKTFSFKDLKGDAEVTIVYWPNLEKTEVSFTK